MDAWLASVDSRGRNQRNERIVLGEVPVTFRTPWYNNDSSNLVSLCLPECRGVRDSGGSATGTGGESVIAKNVGQDVMCTPEAERSRYSYARTT
jgi:hypothetical protein